MSFPGTFITTITKVASAIISLIYDFLWSDRTSEDVEFNGTDFPVGISDAVALSRDGKTAVFRVNGSTVQEWGMSVYELVNNQWQAVAHLEPYPTWSYTDNNDGYRRDFAEQISISGDGNTIIASDMSAYGGPYGDIFVFEKGNGWSNGDANLSAKLYTNPTQGNAYFATGIDINYDGTVIIGGAAGQNHGSGQGGTLFVFEKGNGWVNGSSRQTARLYESTSDIAYHVGTLNAISDDGNTIITCPQRQSGLNAKVYVYEKSGSSWSNKSTPDYQLSYTSSSSLVSTKIHSLDISGDGETIIAGMGEQRPINSDVTALEYPSNSYTLGMILVYSKKNGWSTGTYNFHTALFPGSSYNDVRQFGEFVRISKSGNTIVTAFRYNFVANNNSWPGIAVFQKNPDEDWQFKDANFKAVLQRTGQTSTNNERYCAYQASSVEGVLAQDKLAISGKAETIAALKADNPDNFYFWYGLDPDA